MIASQCKRIRLQINGIFAHMYVRVRNTFLQICAESYIHNSFCLFPETHLKVFIHVQGCVTDPLGKGCYIGETMPVHIGSPYCLT